jgi:hypothetical protein
MDRNFPDSNDTFYCGQASSNLVLRWTGRRYYGCVVSDPAAGAYLHSEIVRVVDVV